MKRFLFSLLFALESQASSFPAQAMYVSTGAESTCVLMEYEQLKCYGKGTYGRLGSGDTKNLGDHPDTIGDHIPVVDLGFAAVANIDIGSRHACAMEKDTNRLKCWGDGSNGELGNERDTIIGDEPNEMGANLPPINIGIYDYATDFSTGDSFTCVLLSIKQVKCFGRGFDGQLGQGNSKSIGSQRGSMGDNLRCINLGTDAEVIQVSAGGRHACALLLNGMVKCWGSGAFGQTGAKKSTNIGDNPGQMGDNLLPVDLGSGRKVRAVKAGGYHTCVLLDNGEVKCFGRNDKGQLGVGSTKNIGTDSLDMGDNLVSVPLGRAAIQIQAGEKVSCAKLDDNSIKCWGDGSHGQLMKGSRESVGIKRGEVENSTELNFGNSSRKLLGVSLSAGSLSQGHACTVISNASIGPGDVYCWGSGFFGQLATGDRSGYGSGSGQTGGYTIRIVDLGPPLLPKASLFEEDYSVAENGSISCNTEKMLRLYDRCRRVRASPENIRGEAQLKLQFQRGERFQVLVKITHKASTPSRYDEFYIQRDPYSSLRPSILSYNDGRMLGKLRPWNNFWNLFPCVQEEIDVIGKDCYTFARAAILNHEEDRLMEETFKVPANNVLDLNIQEVGAVETLDFGVVDCLAILPYMFVCGIVVYRLIYNMKAFFWRCLLVRKRPTRVH